MADLVQITDSNGDKAPLGFLDTGNTQKLDGGASSASTTVFNTTKPTGVLISAPEAFHVEIGSSPTATINSTFLPAGLYETGVRQGHSIAIIKASASTNGDVWVTPYQGDVFS